MTTTPVAPPEAAERTWARLRRVLARLEAFVDGLRWRWKRRFGRLGAVQVLPYRGFAGRAGVWLEGRVLEAKAIEPPAPGDRPWRNLRRMLRRMTSVEIPGATVTVRIGGRTIHTRTDAEGFFHVTISDPALMPPTEEGPAWVPVDLALDEPRLRTHEPARGEILTVGPEAEYVIVSDIDDTVIQTHVTNFWKMVRVTMLGSEHTRLPFEGTDELFRALAAGKKGRAGNPVFYLSRSPWNFYDLLRDFLDRHGLPKGPLLLRDWGLHAEGSSDFKRQRLTQLLEMYPHLPFVLVGDSGQHDPEIYMEIAVAFPGRIRAIYIRDVGRHRSRRAVRELIAESALAGVPMLLMSHAREAREHAVAQGLVL